MATLVCCLKLPLVLALFNGLAEAASTIEMNRALIAFNHDYDTCKGVTASTRGESKMAADQECARAFHALDDLGLNTCYGWRNAECRVVPGDEYQYYQCTCKIAYCDGFSIRSSIVTPFRHCASLMRKQEERGGKALLPTANFQQRRLHYDEALEAADYRRAYIYPVFRGGTGSFSRVYAFGEAGSSGGAHAMCSVGSSKGALNGGMIHADSDGTTNGRMRYECDECNKKVRSARALFNHKRNHHTVGDKYCNICKFTYVSRKSFLDHTWQNHPEVYAAERASRDLSAEAEAVMPYPCTLCRRRFTTDKSLRAHTKIHTTNNTKCPICNQILATRASLKRHMNIHHQGAAIPPPGPRMRESGSGHLTCEMCGNAFTCHNSLREHKKSHTTMDTYCIFCNKTLAAMSAYKTHLKRKHPEIATAEAEAANEQYEEANPEKCGKCGKRFKNPRGLQEHMAFHDGKTTCDICNRAFPRTSSLAAHKKKEHTK